MKTHTRAFRNARKVVLAARAAATNARKTSELAIAAHRVIGKRMALGAKATIDPLDADHAELARILPEKVAAFSEAGIALLFRSKEITRQMVGFGASEMSAAASAGLAMAKCRTPAGMMATQRGITLAWFSRALSHSLALGVLATRSQRAAMAPIHRVAMANARRLG